jgi:hypothetical protein
MHSATTTYHSIAVGTSLLICEPTIEGQESSRSPLKAGMEIPLEFPDDDRSKMIVLKASESEVRIKMPDGAMYLMTPHNTESDPPVGIEPAPGLHTQAWVVRSEL